MALAVTHTFVSGIADDPAASTAGEVLPSHWNAAHTLTGQVDLTSQVTGILPAANGGTGTSTGYLPRTVNAQTGASYTILASDIGKLVTTSNAGAIATTLPQATGSFGAGSILWIENKGAGTNTITPTTSTIDGSATLALTTNQGVTLVSDGTNWTTIRGIGGAGAGLTNFSSDGTTLSGSAQTQSGAGAPVLSLTTTWSNVATTFPGAIKLNVTNTNSAAGSLLMDLQVGGTSQFSVDKTGVLTLPSAGVIWGGSNTTALYFNPNGNYTAYFAATTGSYRVGMDSSPINSWQLNANYALGFGGTSGVATSDTFIYRDGGASHILAIGNGVNAHAIRIYNTTDQTGGGSAPTNYERGVFDWTTSANVLTIGTQAGGTGTLRDLYLISATNTRFYGSSGAYAGRFYFGGPPSLILDGTNSYLIFGSGFDASLGRGAAKVVQIGDGNGASGSNSAGWYNYAGQTRVTADVTNTTTTLATATGLSAALQAGRTYAFEVNLQVTDAAAGGVQAAMVASGGLTATAIQYTGWTVADNAIKAKTNSTALGTVVGSTTTTETSGIVVQIFGTITVNVAGTLNVQFAQNTTNATATTVKRGSYMIVHDVQ